MLFYHVTVKEKKLRTNNTIEMEVAELKEMWLNLN